MIFARFKGPAVKDAELTKGKVYFVRPALEDRDAASFEFIEVTDDKGNVHRVNTEDESFEFIEEVYAVVLAPFDENEVGEVTVLDGVSDDGSMVSVSGFGLHRASDVVVIDRTNVFPGVSAHDMESGRWEKVKRVDECMWILVDDQTRLRSPEEFEFAVSDGSIMVEPLVKCLDDSGEPGLTNGNLYYLKRTDKSGLFVVQNDQGQEATYLPYRFDMK